MKHKKRALFDSLVALLLCFSMLVGTTFAWMTDSVSSGKNLIATGTLDVELYHSNANVTNEQVTAGTNLFLDLQGKPILWEPGAVSYENLRVNNAGDLALAYQMMINTANENYVQEASGVRYSLSQILKVGVVESGITATDRAGVIASVAPENWMKITEFCRNGSLLPEGDGESEQTWGIVIYWEPGDHDNYWNLNNGKTVSSGDALSIDLGIHLIATQEEYESDAFGTDYDVTAKTDVFPVFTPAGSSSTTVVPNEQNQVAEGLVMTAGQVTASVPAGVQLAEGTTELTMSVAEMGATGSNITLGKNEVMRSLDVHIAGVDATNAVPMIIDLGEAMPAGLNIGNLGLYHVENGISNEMTREMAESDVDAHNEYFYDSVTGRVVLAMATFSEVALIADTENAWEGKFDYTWYDASKTELTIANADQLAGFGAIVGGMNGQTKNSFEGKTVNLICDINLGDKESENKDNLIFYPIGYYNSTGSYTRTSDSVTSSVSSFSGTFDGQGHTIANFYQNTWEMFGDYNDGYSAGSNYYKDAMGLFGYVKGGTVQNLTVDHFSSDGEFTPTGVIAAYADGKATFQNIAITNCNPRVYNTGNGGIIGIAGNSSGGDKITLSNITVDNSNKISALWGSYDVACGGLVGMFRGNDKENGSTISFNNCHVAAQMDVYNDVCGNYQYYAYRYAGMIIGSVRSNVEKDGKLQPNMTGITATGCTVNYGTWNDYYYCEFEKNGHPSYSGPYDYKFSRMEHSAYKFTDSNGNGVIDTDEERATMVCDHIHQAAEDNKAIYLPFRQLFTGYSWGVSSIGLEKYGGIITEDQVSEGDQQESVEKFVAKQGINAVREGAVYKLGTFFAVNTENKVEIKNDAITVTVTNAEDNNPVSAKFDLNEDTWENSTITFTGQGAITLTIQDYNFCKPTAITFEVGAEEDIKSTDRFVHSFPNTGKYLYRVGNENAISISSLFKLAEGVNNSEIGKVSIDVKNAGTTLDVYKSGTGEWNSGSIDFDDKFTGLVTITISDDKYSEPLSLNVEVVDAVNATAATSAKSNNVVLLNDVGLNTIEVSNGYTLYGNGFKMTATKDIMHDTLGVGFVTLKNGTLDNVQIICPNFSYSIIYSSQIKEKDNTAVPSDSSNDARGNVRSAVMADGNSKIVNSYVHGGRAAVYLRSGNLLIDGSTISGGAAANIHAVSAQRLTLRNATLIQKPYQATVHDTSKTVMGFSGLFECGGDGAATPLYLEGTLKQNAWACKEYKSYVPSKFNGVVTTVLNQAEYVHEIDNEKWVNMGFAFVTELSGVTPNPQIHDSRTNHSYGDVTLSMLGYSATIYSLKKGNSTPNPDEETNYTPTNQGTTTPTVSFTDTNEDRVFETKFDASDNRWESTLTVNLDNGNYLFNFNKLMVQKHGENLNYNVETENGTAVDTSKNISLTASGVTTYVLTVTDGNATHTVYFTLTATKTSIPDPAVVDTTGGTPLLVVKSKNSDWSCAIPALEGIKVKYYTVDGEVILDLATLTPVNTGKQNGTNNYWETTKDGYKLKITSGYIHEGKQVYGMPVVVDNNGTKQMYFTISSTTGYVSTGTSARSVTLTYEFTDPNGKSITFTKNYNVKYAEYKDKAQYSYSEFVQGKMTDLLTSSSGGGGSSGCVTPDTLITLADGSQVRVDSLTGNEQLLVWNLETGKYDTAPIVFVDNEQESVYEIIHLYFSDGSDVKVIYEHGFFDLDLGKYVYIDATNYADYIGHRFVTEGDIKSNNWNVATLDKVVVETEVTTAWSPVTFEHLCYYTNGMLSMPGGIEGLFNIFNVDTDLMRYDAVQMQKDIETYGLFTLADFGGMITEDAFNAFNGAYLKVAMGKGLLTWEDIAYMAERYIPLM